ncbi:MAG: NAD(P)/FAD-dependent oxidoreductase [Acidimicrobiales bacterium]|jgi:cation diffusion facilitator CzcD-associated flavoprotein CzcO
MALDIGRRTFEREVRRAHVEGRPVPTVAIVGGGLSGLAAAAQLVRSGARGFTIIEQSDGVGGTWRDNVYPGAACDVPSHLYSFSFAQKRDWTRRFAEQPEILSYAEDLVERYRLGPHLRLNTTVDDARFDESTGTWHLGLRSAGGVEQLVADTVVFACGQLNRPHLPDVEGVDGFAGPWWHSARWDHSVDITGKHVAVVGTGASAIQFVPPVAAAATSTTIFQRSPNYVGPKKDHPYRSGTRQLMRRVGALRTAHRWWIYWTLEARWLCFRRDSRAAKMLQSMFAKGIRDSVVSDRLPEHAVVPDYPVGCKRILISNDWYPALLRPDVTVVDSAVVRVEPDAVVTADGIRHPADVLIFGTGFSTTDFLSHIPVTGVDGRRLADAWREGAHAYLGTAVAGFPSCYVLYGPNTNLGHNSILFMVERQLNLVLQALSLQTASSTGVDMPAVSVRDAAYEQDDRDTQRMVAATAWAANCTSWYKNASGRITNNWPSWTVRYWWDTLRLRPADFEVSSKSPAVRRRSA